MYGNITRRRMIWKFVKYGLIPFLNEAGYCIDVSLRTLCSRIATGLYKNQGLSSTESDWNFGQVNTEYMVEDLDRYHYVLGSQEWDAFWKDWNDWDDISLDNWHGQDRRTDIQWYCWTQLNLERSVQTQVVNEFLGFTDEDGEDGGYVVREDVYLQEAKDSNEWGGYRK